MASVALGKGPYQIEVYAVEAASWRGKLAWRRSQLPGSLYQMALMAVVHYILHGFHNPPPDEVGRYESARRLDARVMNAV